MTMMMMKEGEHRTAFDRNVNVFYLTKKSFSLEFFSKEWISKGVSKRGEWWQAQNGTTHSEEFIIITWTFEHFDSIF